MSLHEDFFPNLITFSILYLYLQFDFFDGFKDVKIYWIKFSTEMVIENSEIDGELNNIIYGGKYCRGQLLWGNMKGKYPGKNYNKITQIIVVLCK